MRLDLRQVWTILRKELLDVARDQRALLFMVLVPIAIVPLLMGGMGKALVLGQKKLMQEPSRIAIIGGERGPKIERLVRSFETAEGMIGVPDEYKLAAFEEASRVTPADAAAAAQAAKSFGLDTSKASLLKVVDPPPADIEAAKKAVERRDLDLVVIVPEGFTDALGGAGTARLEVVYDSAYDKSRNAWQKLRPILSTFERGVVLGRLLGKSLGPAFIDPLKVDERTIATKEQEGRVVVSLLLPYMLILMCFSGAVYPAIDLGAGEKERGTLETLLVSPAGRAEIVVGKLLVIFSTSLLAAVLNVVSLGVSLRSGAFPDIGKSMPLSVDPFAGVVAVLLMLPVAAIFASLLLAVSIFAKSFKEAQAYFAPFNIVIILPAFASAIPGLELDWKLALIPIFNISLAIKETLAGTFKWFELSLIVASTLVLASLSVALCARWFRREEVLFRS